MIESFEQIKMLCWVLIIFIGIIGILNIINTVYSNIHTRVGEIGMQRAIGMSAASLYKTFLWEGAYYGIIASVIGAVFGYICCIFVGAAQTDALQLVAVPVIAIVEAAIISIVVCLLATAIPLRSIARMNIVDSIETVELKQEIPHKANLVAYGGFLYVLFGCAKSRISVVLLCLVWYL